MDYADQSLAGLEATQSAMDAEVERRVKVRTAELTRDCTMFLNQRTALKNALMLFIDNAKDSEAIAAFEEPLRVAVYTLKSLHDGTLR